MAVRTNNNNLTGYGTKDAFYSSWNAYYNEFNTSNSPLS